MFDGLTPSWLVARRLSGTSSTSGYRTPMDGAEFLNLAFRLAGGANEAEWRTATSRAYYAAFHYARDLLTGMGFTVPRADQAHQYLYHRLNNCGNPPLIRIASELHQLRRHRN